MENFEAVYDSITEIINKHIKLMEDSEIEMSQDEFSRRVRAIARLNEALESYGKLMTNYNLRRVKVTKKM